MKLIVAKLAAILNLTGKFTTPKFWPGKGANKLHYLLVYLVIMEFDNALLIS